MKLGILQTGRSPDNLQDKYGDYDDFFKRFLGGRGFDFVTYAVLDGELPNDPADADGWLITGSRFGAYEDHDWIPPLEEFLRETYARGVPIVGICFGHQILAQALGGKVEKYRGGWSAGVARYDYEGHPGHLKLIAWHQDQVTELPKDARVIGSSDFCNYAALVYDDRAMTIQPHPEFSTEFAADLVEARRNVLPEHIAENALQTLDSETSSSWYADQVEAFFRQSR